MRGGMRKLLVVDHVGRHTRPSEIELATTGSSRQTTNGGDEARKKRELRLERACGPTMLPWGGRYVVALVLLLRLRCS